MSKKYPLINREISWLHFNSRVLQEAEDERNPLIERMRFLGIFSNNLDEFFKVRVAGLKRLLMMNNKKLKWDETVSLEDLMEEILAIVKRLQKRFELTFQHIITELEHENIVLLDENQIVDQDDKQFIKHYFNEYVWDRLSPVLLSQGNFPYVSDRSIHLAVVIHLNSKTKPEYAIITIPRLLNRLVLLPDKEDKKRIILLDNIIRLNLNLIFKSLDFSHFETYNIKITRDSELQMDDDISQSYMEKISKSLKNRKWGAPVRFVYDKNAPLTLVNFLIKKLEMSKTDMIIAGGKYHNFRDFIRFPSLGKAHLEFEQKQPLRLKYLDNAPSLIDAIINKDVLLHYPYIDFDHVIDLLREAAISKNVEEIRLVLYRAADNSKVVNTLINAANNGKKVTVIVELQARFDEENNIFWANRMTEEGIKVVFGIEGLKVHSKLFIIKGKKFRKAFQIGYIGTGNFNERTAKVYGDIALLTGETEIVDEIDSVFSFFENTYRVPRFKHLLVAPLNARRKFIALVQQETQNAKAGLPAHITLKVNNLTDVELINKLYEASKSGVKIKLIVRGICRLVPGVKSLSNNIEAISILDKYLEHARIYVFGANENRQYFISSADLMERSFDKRVEVMTPIYEPSLQNELQDILDIQWNDNQKSRIVHNKKLNQYKPLLPGQTELRSQLMLYDYYNAK